MSGLLGSISWVKNHLQYLARLAGTRIIPLEARFRANGFYSGKARSKELMAALHISISAEPVFHLGSLVVSNSMLTSSIVSVVLIAIAAVVGSSIKATGKPGRAQTIFEMMIEGLYDFAADMTGSRAKAAAFLPLIMTFFLWIVANNWAGLLPGVGTIGFLEYKEGAHAQVISRSLVASTDPKSITPERELTPEEYAAEDIHTDSQSQAEANGVHAEEKKGTFVPYFRAGTADLNTTIALAVVSVGATQFFGFKYLGGHYLKKYFNFSNPIHAFVGILELVLELAKIMSFAFRLFGNIFAGEVLLAVMLFLVPVIVPMPFYGLEIFVGMIQGVVFAMLSLVFFNLATIGHGEEH